MANELIRELHMERCKNGIIEWHHGWYLRLAQRLIQEWHNGMIILKHTNNATILQKKEYILSLIYCRVSHWFKAHCFQGKY